MGVFNLFKTKPAEPAQGIPTVPKIMVVDDDQFLRTYYHDLLVKNNYEVVMATNGQEAFSIVFQDLPDVILLDIMMPEMDGKTLLKLLRDNAATKAIPVIMLTSAASIKNMEETRMYQVNGFLNKNNVSPEEILAAVQGALLAKPKRAVYDEPTA